jgi:hypothetical protein
MHRMTHILAATAVVAAGSASAATTTSGTGYSLGRDGARLVSFGLDGGARSYVQITTAGGERVKLDDIDIRPNTGELFGYAGETGTMYRIDPNTGVAEPLLSDPTLTTGSAGIDFNNMLDAVRIVTDEGENRVFFPERDAANPA